jgi:K+ transporter
MHQQTYLQSLSKQERISFFQANALKIDEGNYVKILTADEIILRKDTLAESSIKLSDLDEELDKIKKEYKEKMSPFKKEIAVLLTDIRHGQTIVNGNLYHLANHEDGILESYNEEGEFITSRKLRPDERQGGVFQLGMAK